MNKVLNRLTTVLLVTSVVLFAAKAAGAQVRFSDNLLKKDDAWFRSDEARAMADSVIQYQSPQGGWPKSTNLAKPPKSPDDIPPPGRGRANSFDNDATTVPMKFLARITHATGEAEYRDSFLRGLDYTLAAQYRNGGWPQFWPLRKGYYSQITYNDGAMIRVMEVVRDVAKGDAPYAFVEAERRAKAEKAFQLGVECILKTQIRQNGKLTAWCAQHDAKTLEPTWARAYEPPSLSGGESVGIIRFLMEIEEPSDEIVGSIEGAVAWVRSVEMKGWRQERVKNDDGRSERKLVADTGADSLWARFYELKTNRPLYLDRDSKFRYDYNEISYERRSGYSYHGNWGASLLEKDYPRWREKHAVKVAPASAPTSDGARPRVIVSTDIGGTDPDDFQSMVHLLVYADVLDIEGLISSPFGDGRTQAILDVIDCYEKDFPNLKTHSDKYPPPDALRAITKQGETDRAPYTGFRKATEGSKWLVDCARRDDPRPLHVLVWGGIEDVAQALHDAPDILSKLRVYWIGGPNKKWAPDAYQYIAENHRKLWMIESNAAYRGWFTGGNQSGDWDNQRFVAKHVKGKGALGDFFVEQKADVKMGDTPSVGWLLKGKPDDPTQPGWGGSFVRAWERPHLLLDRMPTKSDSIEVFGILELVLQANRLPENPEAFLKVENQELVGHFEGDGTVRFRFCPKAAKRYNFEIASNAPSLDGKAGTITAYIPAPEVAKTPSHNLPNWWTDNLSPVTAEGPHSGAKTVSRWREEFLGDFAKRMLRCSQPAAEARVSYKPRVINTTDLGADPDDEQSMVRQLVCANEFDIEGLIVSTGCWKKTQSNTQMLDRIVDAYAECYDNLTVHADGFPTPEYLRSISVMGQTGYGMQDVGHGKDSPGSELIIASVDKDDPRPIWVGAWGGANNVAQAIWKVKETRSKDELKKFLSKLRVFDILGQDDAGAWIAKNYPEVLYIRAVKVYGWQPPKNGDYQRNDIQSHGPLGAVYPDTKWATEGDTPAFMHIYPNGLNDPDEIDQGGWGGRFSWKKQVSIKSMRAVKEEERQYDPYKMYGNSPDGTDAIKRWSKGYNNDFAARMDWSITAKYEDANHHPVAVVNGDETKRVLEVSAAPGSKVTLDAAGSGDPDKDGLTYAWSFYRDPSSYNGDVKIKNESGSSTTISIPADAGRKNLHIILEVHDDGTPNLYAYRRVIIKVN